MRLAKARRRVLSIWLAGLILPFGVILAQTIAGRYGMAAEEAWGWLLASTMPTMGLMLGVALGTRADDGYTASFPVTLCIVFSTVYLLLLSGTLLVQPFARWTAFELFKLSHLWLAPTQALVDATIAVVYLSPTSSQPAEPRKSRRVTSRGTD
jgi:hypothetical protein